MKMPVFKRIVTAIFLFFFICFYSQGEERVEIEDKNAFSGSNFSVFPLSAASETTESSASPDSNQIQGETVSEKITFREKNAIFWTNLLNSINFYSRDYSLIFQNGLTLESGTDGKPQHLGPDFSITFDQKEILIFGGMRFFQESFDLTQEWIYWPTFFENHQLGTGAIFHYYDMYRLFREFDFLPGLYYRYDNHRWFKFTGSLLYFRKDAYIDFSGENAIHIGNNNLAAKFSFEIRPVNKFQISLDFSSYSLYRYMLFFAPDLNLKFSLNLSKNFTTGLEFDVQYVDLFTLSANFNCISFRTFVSMEI